MNIRVPIADLQDTIDMNCPKNTVYKRLYRSNEKLRKTKLIAKQYENKSKSKRRKIKYLKKE